MKETHGEDLDGSNGECHCQRCRYSVAREIPERRKTHVGFLVRQRRKLKLESRAVVETRLDGIATQ